MPDGQCATVTLRGKIRELFCCFLGLGFWVFFHKRIEQLSTFYQESENQSRTFIATANDLSSHTSNKQKKREKWKTINTQPKEKKITKLTESSNLALLYEELAFLS